MDEIAASRGGRLDVDLVGRDEELAQLDDCLQRSVQLHVPQTVLLIGNRGMGKTRLVEHWLAGDVVAQAGPRILRVSGADGERTYGLVNGLLEQRLFSDLASDGERDAHFRQGVEEVVQDRRLAEFLHFLGGFVGLTVRDNPFIRALEDAPIQHDQIARTVLRRFFELDAEQRPLVLFLDDLDAADDASLDIVCELAEQLGGAPVMIVACGRPGLLARDPRLKGLDGEYQLLDLNPLDPEQSCTLIEQMLARVEALPAELVEQISELTGGNPLFAEHLVAALIDDGTIEIDGDRWRIDAERAREIDLPLSMEEAVRARIALLDPAERDVLQKASIIGSVFWRGCLICFARYEQQLSDMARVWAADALEQTIGDILASLVERDYLLQLPDSTIAGEWELAFKHNLERELIAELVDSKRRAQLHLIAAQWLESRLPDRSEAQLEELARHYQGGGNLRRAGYCFVHAGDKARSRYANQQAVNYYERGLELLDLDDALSKIEALHNLGDVYVLTGRNRKALDPFFEMLRLAWLLDNKAKGGAAHRRIGRAYRALGEHERALHHLRAAHRLFKVVDDQRGVAATLDDLGQVMSICGEYQRALEHHEEALTIKRDIGDPRAIAVSLHNLGGVHRESGGFKPSEQHFVEALEVRKAIDDRSGIADSLDQLACLQRARSDYGRALSLWTEALKVARDIGDRLREAHVLMCLGECLAQLGRPEQASGHLDEAAQLAADAGDRQLVVGCARALAEVRLALGDAAGAQEHADRAQSVAEQLQLRPEQAQVLRTLAEIAAAQNERESALELYQRAIALFEELGSEPEIARCYASLGNYHDRLGNWKEAELLRARADEIFGRIGR